MKTISEIAEVAKISPATVRVHHKAANNARAAGTTTATTLPAPAGKDDHGRLVWNDADVEAWVEARATTLRPGQVPQSVLREILAAAEAGNLPEVITITKGNLA